MDRLEEVTITEYDDFLHNYPAQNTKVDYHNPGDRVCVYDFTGWKEGDRLNDYLIAMRNKDDTQFWIRRTPKYAGNMSPVLPTNFVIPERYQEFIEYENTILNWLDGQIRQSVAQEIFEELKERANAPLPERPHGKMSHKDYLNTPVITIADIYDILSKYMEGKDE